MGWRPTGEKNPHIAIIGQSGTGKTQTVKSVIREGQKLGISFLILDYHDGYTDLASRTIDVRKGLSINPLEVPGTSEVDTSYLVASVFRRLGLVGGDQQEAFFRKAIFLSYGIDPDRSMKPLPSLVPKAAPTFADVRRSLSRIEASDSAARRVVPALKNRLGIIFDLGLFQRPTEIPFGDLTTGTTVVSLKSLPTDETRLVVSDFFLRKLWDFVYRWGPSPGLRLFCVADEAHRLAYSKSPVDTITREARKYSVGMILASQSPHDFDSVVFANVASKLCFRCSLEEDAQFMARQMGCDAKQLMGLSEEGEAFLRLGSSEAPERIRASMDYRRMKQKPADSPKDSKLAESEPEVDGADREKTRFGGQVRFGEHGLRGNASLKNWKKP